MAHLTLTLTVDSDSVFSTSSPIFDFFSNFCFGGLFVHLFWETGDWAQVLMHIFILFIIFCSSHPNRYQVIHHSGFEGRGFCFVTISHVAQADPG